MSIRITIFFLFAKSQNNEIIFLMQVLLHKLKYTSLVFGNIALKPGVTNLFETEGYFSGTE